MSATTDDGRVGRMQDQMVHRRTVLKAAGAGGAIVATGGLSTTVAADDEGVFNRASEYAPNLRSSDTVTFAEHDMGSADSAFYFVDDSGEEDDLTNYGAGIAPREDADEDVEDPIPHNPIGLAANRIEADAYDVFPRGETKEDADGDEVDVSALQAEEWDVGSSITATDEKSEANGPGVTFDVDGGAISGTETATFSSFDAIDSGVARRRLFAGLDVRNIGTGGTVEVQVRDGSDRTKSVEVTEGDSQIIQERLGDLDSSGEDFGDVVAVEFSFADAGAEVHVFALDVERERELTFGEQEAYEDADEDSLETVDVETPSGTYWVTGLETLDDVFSSASIVDLQVETAFNIEQLPLEYIDVEYDVEEAETFDEMFMETLVVNFELPNPFDVTYEQPDLMDDVVLPARRYREVRTTSDDDLVTIAEIEDDDTEYSWTDRSDRYSSKDETVTLESELVVGEHNAVEFTRLIRENEQEDLMSGSASMGGPVDTRSGGLRSWVFSPLGAIVSAIGLAGLFRSLSKRLGR